MSPPLRVTHQDANGERFRSQPDGSDVTTWRSFAELSAAITGSGPRHYVLLPSAKLPLILTGSAEEWRVELAKLPVANEA